jgi:hypothetical protein
MKTKPVPMEPVTGNPPDVWVYEFGTPTCAIRTRVGQNALAIEFVIQSGTIEVSLRHDDSNLLIKAREGTLHIRPVASNAIELTVQKD